MSIRADDLFTRAAPARVGSAAEQKVSRLVWLSSFGVGDTYGSARAVQKITYSTFLRNVYANKAFPEKAIRSSGLDWTLVHPTMLAKGPYLVGERLPMKGTRRSAAPTSPTSCTRRPTTPPGSTATPPSRTEHPRPLKPQVAPTRGHFVRSTGERDQALAGTLHCPLRPPATTGHNMATQGLPHPRHAHDAAS
ncbi:NAD(P)H-binding protein [Streptomyces sp. 11x1]|uniref:NAD(P)H-binding protein n=1 Tax=Streptomyces sp. 11x1 TaxID=3038642 RepID=UPI00292F227B|nr:NAD(P)H-binding protein [Streptomyces sp. 11x1]WNZ11758.1 NAD(P)H-binding protein [Streptomyces sp. 11x1]